jgi:hypothetical protein
VPWLLAVLEFALDCTFSFEISHFLESRVAVSLGLDVYWYFFLDGLLFITASQLKTGE